MRSWRPVLVTGLALISAQLPAHAADGVVEVSQSRAVTGGVTAGDAAGFPVTLSEPGSYVLTSNLDVRGVAGAADATSIDVTADDIELDLNGFRIIGPTSCAGAPGTITCTAGAGIGIRSIGRNTKIRGGSVSGFGGGGVALGAEARVIDIRASHNGTVGIAVGNLAVVQNAVATGNDGPGIATGANAAVSGCNASENDRFGLSLGDGTGFADCVLNDNGLAAVNGGTPLGSNLCDGSPSCSIGCFDADADGYAAACTPVDCDDGDPAAYPGAPELCDSDDNDCDFQVDEDGACSGSCSPFNPSLVCGPGVHCIPQTTPNTGACDGAAGAGLQGSVCSTLADCAPGFGCFGAPANACLRLCLLASPNCPGGLTCTAVGSWYGACI